MRITTSEFFKKIIESFPLPELDTSNYEERYVVTRALYFYVQHEIRLENWGEVKRVFDFLADLCSGNTPGWLENAVLVEFIEDFDFQNKEIRVQDLMGGLLKRWYLQHEDYITKNYTESQRAERRKRSHQFDQVIYASKQKGKRSPRIRKPVNQLKLSDLRQFKIWEFCTESESCTGQDETWVRPVKNSSVPLNAYNQLVSTIFTTAKNIQLHGFTEVTTVGEVFEILPGAIIKSNLYLPIPRLVGENESFLGERRQFHLKLGVSENDLFPLRYRLLPLIAGENGQRSGNIE